MRTTLTGTGLSYDDLCMHANLDLPEGFKVPHFELFNRTGNSKAHLWAYCDQLVGVRDNQALIMRLFSRSLTGEASEWFTAQDIRRWITWEDMAVAFIERFLFNMETVLDRYYMEKVKQKSTENFREYASRWRTEASRVQPSMGEEELVSIFIRSQEINSMIECFQCIEDCINLKFKMQDLIDQKEIVLQTAPPNMQTNPLSNYGNSVIHMIERKEDWVAGRPIIRDSVKELERTVASLSLQECPRFKVLIPAPVTAHIA
ncbi:uncharacterized protein LOC132639413 [Lycium barbarum]|uniref:uncharacterized protein LOC132639413 n=1 Tax=Lycium barbarum TaxID=112863 RepID=UPI00293E4DD8|nr:uncharacterized protein LOC132639413 [Lycium barbarum]